MNDGGPAFPGQRRGKGYDAYGDAVYEYMSGMSLRDWFAGQALAGVLANQHWCDIGDEARIGIAWDHADAMLKARAE